MALFTFKLENEDGSPADPPRLHTAVPNWRPGDTIPLGPGKTLLVVDVQPGKDADVLVVEWAERPAPGSTSVPLRFPREAGRRP